jgi:hypothetical protein
MSNRLLILDHQIYTKTVKWFNLVSYFEQRRTFTFYFESILEAPYLFTVTQVTFFTSTFTSTKANFQVATSTFTHVLKLTAHSTGYTQMNWRLAKWSSPY